MSLTSVQLWERIHNAGLASTEDCRKWAIEISHSRSPECLHDPSKLASELIRLGKITTFQANVVFGNSNFPLSLGPHRILESLESRLGPNWLLAIDSSRPNQPSRWCYLLTSQDMQQPELQKWPPSLELAIKQVAINHPSLDKWIISGIDKTNFVSFSEALEGQSLTAVLTNRPLNWTESTGMVEQIAAGLQRMHDAGLVHGCVCPDAIWCVDDGEFLLRRDPVFPASNPYLSIGKSILTVSMQEKLSVAAPELTLPNASHSFQTDLYALGCVWFRSLTRGSPFRTETHDTALAWSNAHTVQAPKSLDPRMLPDPLQRCLMHLIAKNPSARFASATALIKAIEFAVEETERQQHAQNKPGVPSVDVMAESPVPVVIEKPIVPPSQRKPSEGVMDLPKALSTSVASKANRSSANRSGKKKPKKKKKPFWILPSIVGGACLVFGLIIALLVRNGPSTGAAIPKSASKSLAPALASQDIGKHDVVKQATESTRSGNTAAKSPESVSEYFAVEADDGQLLWSPPHAGSPYSLEMFPTGLEAVVFVSGRVWHRQGNSGDLVKWWMESQPDLARVLAEFPLLVDDRIESIAIGLYPSTVTGVPQPVFRITYSQMVTVNSVAQTAQGFALQLFDSTSHGMKGLWSNAIQSNSIAIAMDGMQTDGIAKVKRAAVGPRELIATLLELNGAQAPLRRQLETLLRTTDSRSDLTILFAPSFLFGDGRELLSGAPKLHDVLRKSIDDSMQAIAFTTTIEPRWYMELRMLSSETRDAGKFTAALKASLLNAPDEFEKGLSSGRTLHPYWRALGLRYPQMMRTLIRFGRLGLEDGQVVANAYLPSDAVNSVAIANWMALQNPTEGPVATIPVPTNKTPAKSIEEILESKISIGFEQESLEAALQLISNEVAETATAGSPIAFAINGSAFQKEGITRNQSVRSFKHVETPLRVILTDLVRRANPVTTIQSPTERNQKVVWLVLEDTERPGQKRIELTTRAWSEANDAILPKEFIAE